MVKPLASSSGTLKYKVAIVILAIALIIAFLGYNSIASANSFLRNMIASYSTQLNNSKSNLSALQLQLANATLHIQSQNITKPSTISNAHVNNIQLLVSNNEGATYNASSWELPTTMEGTVIPVQASVGVASVAVANVTVSFSTSSNTGYFVNGDTCTTTGGSNLNSGTCIVAYFLPTSPGAFTITAQIGTSIRSLTINLK
jgi:hypothetical protein